MKENRAENMNTAIDWADVENKISIILRKFSNIDPKYKDDLAQELRIHAYYKSDDYYNLYRKAIDFWRQLHTRQYPEIPFFDLELIGGSSEDKGDDVDFNTLVSLVNTELNRKGHGFYDEQRLELCRSIFTILVDEVQGTHNISIKSTDTLDYFGGRISLTWLAEQLDVHYKAVQKAMAFLTETIQGLEKMGKISLDDEYKGQW